MSTSFSDTAGRQSRYVAPPPMKCKGASGTTANDFEILPALPGKSYIIHGFSMYVKTGAGNDAEAAMIALRNEDGTLAYIGYLGLTPATAQYLGLNKTGFNIKTSPGTNVYFHWTAGKTITQASVTVFYSVVDGNT